MTTRFTVRNGNAARDTSRAPRSLWSAGVTPDPDAPRFLSQDACRALADRVFAMRTGGGDAELSITSDWRANLRWARNVMISGGDTQETRLGLSRDVQGAKGSATTNVTQDDMLADMVRRAEAIAKLGPVDPYEQTIPLEIHPHSHPNIWFDRTYNVDAAARNAVATGIIARSAEAGVSCAGYVEVSATGEGILTTEGLFRYYPFTTAQFSLTVRDPQHLASGWAGIDFADWGRIDAAKLADVALDKCLKSRNPVAIEPGRYTAILEPQAVCDLFAPILDHVMGRAMAEQGQGPFAAGRGRSKIGQRVLDSRITVTADPMDPDLGFIPFDTNGEPYQNTTWIADGVLKELAYDRYYSVTQLGKDWALQNSKAFKMSGGAATVADMITNTMRGVLVTRFSGVQIVDRRSMLMNGNTRDGLWLIENGKISKAIKNFRFTESPLFAFNNVAQLGVPQRVFRPGAPAVCPPALVRDFSFTGLSDAI